MTATSDIEFAERTGESLFVDFDEVTLAYDDYGDRDLIMVRGVCKLCRKRATGGFDTLAEHARLHVDATPRPGEL